LTQQVIFDIFNLGEQMRLLKWTTNVLMVLVLVAAMAGLLMAVNSKNFGEVIDAIVMDIP